MNHRWTLCTRSNVKCTITNYNGTGTPPLLAGMLHSAHCRIRSTLDPLHLYEMWHPPPNMALRTLPFSARFWGWRDRSNLAVLRLWTQRSSTYPHKILTSHLVFKKTGNRNPHFWKTFSLFPLSNIKRKEITGKGPVRLLCQTWPPRLANLALLLSCKPELFKYVLTAAQTDAQHSTI